MRTHGEKIKSLLFTVLLFIPLTYANAYDVKPDIVNTPGQQIQSRLWQRNHFFPNKPYQETKDLLQEKLLESEHFIKISSMLHTLLEKQKFRK